MSTAACTFDAAAHEYAAQLEHGISISGESAEYFVRGRVAMLARFLARQRPTPNIPGQEIRVLDFGCGVGNACGALSEQLQTNQVVGLDCSPESIRLAQRRYGGSGFEFLVDGTCIQPASMDVVYTSGVFHHIEPESRQSELDRIYAWLKPGGVLALFENNPWNPGTRWVMSRIPFDRDAQCLSPLESRRRLRAAGFELRDMRSLFYFPRLLHWLRPLERLLAAVPLGAQYVVLARKP